MQFLVDLSTCDAIISCLELVRIYCQLAKEVNIKLMQSSSVT